MIRLNRINLIEKKCVDILKVALVSAFLEDDVYEHILDEKFMEEVICNEDHIYHRIARSLSNINIEPIVFMMSQKKDVRKFTHKYGHTIMRIPALRIPFIHEPIVYSSHLINYLKKDFDICHFVGGYYVMYKIPDMFDYTVMKLHNRVPIVARWAGGNHKWLWPIRKSIKKMSLQRCDKITCSGKEEIKILKTKFQIPADRISYLLNPMDLQRFQIRDRNKIAEKLKERSEFRYVLYVGRLVKNKGLEELLDVFKNLNEKFPDVKLIIIGDGSLYDEILSYIKQNNFEDSIFLKGRLSHDLISYYYNISDVLIMNVLSGSLANVIIEAIASGLPIVASDIGTYKEFVDEKKGTGVLIKPGNKKELYDGIVKILENKKAFSKNNRNLVKEFSYENFSKNILNIYEEITK